MVEATPSPAEREKKRCSWIMDRPGSKGDFQCGLMVSLDSNTGVPLCSVHLQAFFEASKRTMPDPSRDKIARLKSRISKLEASLSLRESEHSDAIKRLLAQNKLLVGEVYKVSARLTDSSRVYLIRCGDRVKIGRSGNPRKRLEQIRRGDACLMDTTLDPADSQLIYEMPGHAKEETALHQRFKAYRTAGEWFRIEGELKEYIATLDIRKVRGGLISAP